MISVRMCCRNLTYISKMGMRSDIRNCTGKLLVRMACQMDVNFHSRAQRLNSQFSVKIDAAILRFLIYLQNTAHGSDVLNVAWRAAIEVGVLVLVGRRTAAHQAAVLVLFVAALCKRQEERWRENV